MRVVFLDVDGVLNSLAYYDRCNRRPPGPPIDPEAVARLDRLARAAKATVVVRSSWRRMFKLPVLRGLLRDNGYIGPVVGRTPYLSDGCRGDEIQLWLDRYGRLFRPVSSFVILDDADDMAHLAARLVRTRYEDGLTDADVERALALLVG
jgi:hypothetical protein